MIFSKVRCTTKRKKCQSFLYRSPFGNHSMLGSCFHLKPPSSGSADMTMSVKGGGAGQGEERRGRKGGEAAMTKQCWIYHCGKDTSWIFHPFVWNWAGLMSLGTAVSLTLRPLYLVTTWGRQPFSRPTGSEREATGTFMHKCLLHALNGCGLDGFLLLMHYQWDPLAASQP